MIFAALLVASKKQYLLCLRPQDWYSLCVVHWRHSRNRSVFCYFLAFKKNSKKIWRVWPDTEKISGTDGASPKQSSKNKKSSDFCHLTMFFLYSIDIINNNRIDAKYWYINHWTWVDNYLDPLVKRKWCKFRGLCLHSTNVIILPNKELITSDKHGFIHVQPTI